MQNCGILQTVWQQLLAVSGGEFHVKTSKRCKICMAETVVKFPKKFLQRSVDFQNLNMYQAGHSNYGSKHFLFPITHQNSYGS